MDNTDTALSSATCHACSLLSESLKLAQTPRSPRILDLLRSRDALYDVQLANLRDVEQSVPGLIQAIDQEIPRLKEMLENLSAARKQAESNLADAKCLLNPIRSLPSEILHEIFTYCVPDTSATLPGRVDSLNPDFEPWTLSRVCHTWRELVISSPLLWTYFKFDSNSHGQTSAHQCTEKTSRYLERSRDLSLSIFLFDRRGVTVHHPALPALKRAMSRCRLLMFQDISTRCLRALSGIVFSRLSLLSVTGAFQSSRSALQVDTFNPASAPKLRTVSSYDSHWDSFEFVVIPWSPLREVYSFPLFDDVGVQRLRDMHNIEYLHVTILQSCIPPGTVIPLRSLIELRLIEPADAQPGCAKEFMAALALPSLSMLRLEYPPSRHLLFPEMGVFADNLQVLTLDCTTLGHPDNIHNLLQFLSLCPRVHTLNLLNNPLEAPFVAGLRYSSTTARLPRLRTLDITQCLTPAHDVSAIFDMVKSRRREEDGSPPRQRLRALYAPQWLLSLDDERWKEILKSARVLSA